GKLFKLDSNGLPIQTIDTGSFPSYPVFDGTNIWVPNSFSNTITVVRVSTGKVIATLSDFFLQAPNAAAFDGERIVITNDDFGGFISVWKAADMTPINALGP